MMELPKNFYPTPPKIVERMLRGVDFLRIESILEPSAGKGNIARACQLDYKAARRGSSEDSLDLDCIEIDENLRHILKGNGLRVVGDDFMRYTTAKQYDLIIANPPFDAGDEHLLKMLDMQQRGGCVICLLNAETIRNPYTDRRKHLVRRLKDLGAEIEYIPEAFKCAERKTDIEVALVRAYVPEALRSFILDGLIEAEKKGVCDF